MAVKRKLSKKQAKQVRKNNSKSQKSRYQKGGAAVSIEEQYENFFK